MKKLSTLLIATTFLFTQLSSFEAFTVSPLAKTRFKVGLKASPEAVVTAVGKQEKVSKEAQELLDVLENRDTDKHRLVIAQTAPAVRVALPEEFGLPPGSYPTGIMIAALKKLGFDLVFDTNTAADLCICEEGTELLHRVKARLEHPEENPMPLFTSCCPGWMNGIGKIDPSLIPYVSSCKSPHMMYGAVVKEFSEELLGTPPDKVYFCSIMPCTRKRAESDEPAFTHDGIRDVDNVITTQDLGVLLRRKGIDPAELEVGSYDSPFQVDGAGTGAGQLFGATGGVMEAAVRTAYELATGEPLQKIEIDEVRGLEGVREASIPLHTEDGKGLPVDLKVAVVCGLGNAKKLIKKLSDGEVYYDFVEVMACPAGCISGGGQPRGEKDSIEKRLKVIYDLDRSLPRRKSHENPNVQALYEKFLGEYGSERAHELLHVEPVYGRGSESPATSEKE